MCEGAWWRMSSPVVQHRPSDGGSRPMSAGFEPEVKEKGRAGASALARSLGPRALL